MLDAILAEWQEVSGNHAWIPDDAVEFLYEAIQQRQRDYQVDNTVYLSTVYAAKGLEFDHVYILGNWTKQGTIEKQERERRPYYVGMTRACETLTLYELAGIQNPYTTVLSGSVLRHFKEGTLSGPTDDDLNLHHSLLDLTSIWIDYPAVADNSNYVRQEIAKLRTCSEVYLKKQGKNNRVFITNEKGHKIGILSEAASSQWANRLGSIQTVRIHSIISWRKDFSSRVLTDCPEEWEVPLLEVVWKE